MGKSKSTEDHLGNKFNSITEMCNHYKIKVDIYKSRLRYGWNQEAALTTPVIPRSRKRNEPWFDHKGNEYASLDEMCNHYGIKVATFRNKLYSGLPLEKCLQPIKEDKYKSSKCCKDHLGNKFQSIADMCDYWGLPYSLFNTRKSLGWDLEQILTEKPRRKITKEKVKDYTGKQFPTVKDMCDAYGVSLRTYQYRIAHGWDKKSALLK